ncbi:pentatricopeptide repeat-containing protein At1g62350-like [Gastrolobium bilobum]|uniref:pentatricopeptide repeat-containing protein At1g62350-like n=1 Tax=Gastrolobium bilobum TaxID=150636 RepID=UPI002AAF6213|nr:pentatricopeptide repeat-containing protein At1g62350-like [Gastrolobium bilobum]
MILRANQSLTLWSFFRRCGNEERRFLKKTSIDFQNINDRKVIVCGLRSSYSKRPRSKCVLSKESIQVIHALKLAKSKSSEKLHQILNSSLTRLLNRDLLDVLAELQRQNELHLSLKVFNFIREEPEYDKMLSLYADMILLLGRNKMIEEAEELFSEVVERGLKPDTRMCTEMIGAYLQVGMIDKAMEIYGSMKENALGCSPDKLTFTILIRNLEKNGQEELAATLKQECVDYVESPDKFLKEVDQIHGRKRYLNLA